jgi:hypothetical protein
MTSMIATMKSPLQASISSAADQVVAIICKGRDAFGRPNLIVVGHGEKIKRLIQTLVI